MNQNETHLSKHLWSIVYSCKVRRHLHGTGNSIQCQKRYWEYLQEHLLQDLHTSASCTFKRSKNNLPSTSNIPSFLSQVPFLPRLSFLVHFVDENRGHYLTNPNHALFFPGKSLKITIRYPYVSVVRSLQDFGNLMTPGTDVTDVLFFFPSPGCLHPLGPTGNPPVSVPCLSSIVAAVLHPPVEQQEMAGTSIDLSKATHL